MILINLLGQPEVRPPTWQAEIRENKQNFRNISWSSSFFHHTLSPIFKSDMYYVCECRKQVLSNKKLDRA